VDEYVLAVFNFRGCYFLRVRLATA
jgi:hypothetical protein